MNSVDTVLHNDERRVGTKLRTLVNTIGTTTCILHANSATTQFTSDWYIHSSWVQLRKEREIVRKKAREREGGREEGRSGGREGKGERMVGNADKWADFSLKNVRISLKKLWPSTTWKEKCPQQSVPPKWLCTEFSSQTFYLSER